MYECHAMTEQLLQFIWQYRLFPSEGLRTTSGELVEIVHPGRLNADAGPDFANARVRIGDTLWAGNVEIHLRASDWKRHHHTSDKLYDNVILHVVTRADTQPESQAGRSIPVLCIPIPENLGQVYNLMLKSREKPPCRSLLKDTDSISLQNFLFRLASERLESKAKRVVDLVAVCRNDWEQAFYISVCRTMGYGPNTQPFEELAIRTPFSFLRKYSVRRLTLEAILFGQAGLLMADESCEYSNALQKEYNYIKVKHKLPDGHISAWKFFRVRPVNFPTLRIAQLAAFLEGKDKLFAQAMEINSLSEALKYFNCQVSEYWKFRYRFGPVAKVVNQGLGRGTIHNLLINVLVPFQFAYGQHTNNQPLSDSALQLLESIEPEDNRLVRPWSDLGMKLPDALHSQALIQLDQEYCNRQRCLHCQIGYSILCDANARR